MWKCALLALASAVAVVSAQKAEDYKVTHLPGIDSADLTLSQYAGHIELDPRTHGNMFFWMIEQTHETNPEKLIIWLNGGPGCSSMDGLFLENGPYRVNPDMSLNITAGGWQDHATIVFLDQPVGTGLSFVDSDGYMKNMKEVTDDFALFLDKFFELFPNLQQRDLYLAGESYAGTYIPYFAKRMLELNKKGERNFNLQGLAIGNGWIAPRHQYEAYYDFAIAKDLIPERRKKLAESEIEKCRKDLAKKESISIGQCESVLDVIMEGTVYEEDNVKYCINEYDIRITDELYSEGCGMAWPHELDQVTTYLRTDQLVAAVHAEGKNGGWNECTGRVSSHLDTSSDEPAYNLLPDILKETRVLLFSGDQDLICNVLGTQYLIGNMTWNGEKGFQSTESVDWYIDDKIVGTYTEDRNLTFAVVLNGSHMLPYDKPFESLDMINRFMGVGDNKVNGKTSRLGDTSVQVDGEPQTTGGPAESDGDDESTDWSQYYSWGTSALIVVILFAGIAGYCWYKSKKQAREGYTRPSSTTRDGEPMGGGFLGLFGKGKRSNRPKLRLDDQDDTNELDELVIETPTLFAAEEYSDDDHQRRSMENTTGKSSKKDIATTRFAIAEEGESDDDFEDFADWDDGDNSTLIESKKPSKSNLKKD
ncbi:alpha/beta-hydrolase [Lichtheimia hyalospora FSU 10163]|nr:alpha/beta-hydrolase [Lichtheimia hyalospora FSU 10163]